MHIVESLMLLLSALEETYLSTWRLPYPSYAFLVPQSLDILNPTRYHGFRATSTLSTFDAVPR